MADGPLLANALKLVAAGYRPEREVTCAPVRGVGVGNWHSPALNYYAGNTVHNGGKFRIRVRSHAARTNI